MTPLPPFGDSQQLVWIPVAMPLAETSSHSPAVTLIY